jgi:hypothetical protein
MVRAKSPSPKRSHARRPTRECRVDGCQAITRGGKPYCIDHVQLNPHPQLILGTEEFERCTRPPAER